MNTRSCKGAAAYACMQGRNLEDGHKVVLLTLRPLLQALASLDDDTWGPLVTTQGASIMRLVSHKAFDGGHHAAQRRHLVQHHL